MKKVHFATKNEAKVISLRKILAPRGIEVVYFPFKFDEPRSDDLGKIAAYKAMTAYPLIQESPSMFSGVVAIDAGFYISAYGNFPGPFVNFILNNPHFGIRGILKLVAGGSRICAFEHCLAYFDSQLQEPVVFKDRVSGVIADCPQGEIGKHIWSRLGLIFMPDGENKTLAEMSEEEYGAWSKARHYGRDSYANLFAEWFVKHRMK